MHQIIRYQSLIIRYQLLAVISIGLIFSGSSTVTAETIKRAMARAYQENPTLRAERARLRATDEGVAIARSGHRPTITGNIDYNKTHTRINPDRGTNGRNLSRAYSITVNQPIFKGYRIVNAEAEADLNVLAGRYDLKNVEQSVLIDVVTAYMDVLRDRATVKLRQRNINVLQRELKATRDRFSVGEVTKTDVAQAMARKSQALADLTIAQANLKVSSSNYIRVVGSRPGSLGYPSSIESLLPKSLNRALERGAQEHPQIQAALYRERAARYKIKQIQGERLPDVNLSASYTHTDEPSIGTRSTDVTSIRGTVRIPLYQSGSVYARIRQSREVATQRRLQVDEARRQISSSIIAAWGQLTSARTQIRAGKASVSANKTALNGVREEEKVGQRTVLDTLNAEQEVLNSEVTLIRARRDYYVAAFTLLSATGRLNVIDVNAPVGEYNSAMHYDLVKDKWRGASLPDMEDTQKCQVFEQLRGCFD